MCVTAAVGKLCHIRWLNNPIQSGSTATSEWLLPVKYVETSQEHEEKDPSVWI